MKIEIVIEMQPGQGLQNTRHTVLSGTIQALEWHWLAYKEINSSFYLLYPTLIS